MSNANTIEDWPVIHSYSRAQAIEDGFLVDLTEVAREHGYRVPVALTRSVWDECVDTEHLITDEVTNTERRMSTLLTILMNNIRYSTDKDADRIEFAMMYIPNIETPGDRNPTPELIELKAIIGPGDDPRPVMTIMRKEED